MRDCARIAETSDQSAVKRVASFAAPSTGKVTPLMRGDIDEAVDIAAFES